MTVLELRDLLLGEKQNEGYRMYSEVVDNSGPLAAWTHEFLDSLFGRSLLARHIIAFVIIFAQSAYIGFLFISKKVCAESTYIPSLMFGILFFFSWDTLSLSNELLGSGFLLLALTSIFEEIEFRSDGSESVFSVGLFISLATLYTMSFIVYLPCALAILVVFTRSDIRKVLLLIFGFLLPHMLTLSIAYLTDSAEHVWNFFYLSNLTFDRTSLISLSSLLFVSAIPLAYLVISLVMLNREARFSKYQSQILQAMLFWIFFSLLFAIFSKDLRPQTLIVFIPGLSLLLTHFFLMIRRKKFIVLNTCILFAGIVLMAYLTRFDVVGFVDYSDLVVRQPKDDLAGKRILVLDEGYEVYADNKLATPFLNWKLSQAIFENPEYYSNVTRVYQALRKDPPQIILDKRDLMADFLPRIPEIRAQYVRQGDRYVRKVSN